MNTELFRTHLRERMQITRATQIEVEEKTGVSQASISRFLSAARINSDNLFKLWEFVYEGQFPAAPSTPTEPEEVSHGLA